MANLIALPDPVRMPLGLTLNVGESECDATMRSPLSAMLPHTQKATTAVPLYLI